MSARRVKPDPALTVSRGAVRGWPPVCEWCANPEQGYPGWTGEPNDTQSPYIWCSGKPERHQRTPVGAR